jgi:hypothetical protein|tara:strand:+ start:458 stop:679 length:222 start_codon:yes stop_codon:yes gene_type:complete
MTKLNVKDKPHLVRDTNSGAILNINASAYEKSKRIRIDAEKQRDELRGAVREINNIKCEMHEMKQLLIKLIEK